MRRIFTLLLLTLALNARATFFDTAWNRDSYRWGTNITFSGGTISAGSYLTGVRFINQVQQWGLRERIGRANLYLGNQTNAMCTPIITDWNGGGVLNDDLIAFVAADYTEATGLTGNGSTKYLRCSKATGLNLSSFGGSANLHLAAYVRTGSNEASDVSGVSDAGGTYALGIANAGVTYVFMGAHTSNTVDSLGKGVYCSTRTVATAAATYKDGVQLVNDTVSDGGVLGNVAFVVHAINVNGSVVAMTSRAISYYGVGLSLTAAQQVPYRIAVRNVQVALGRNVE